MPNSANKFLNSAYVYVSQINSLHLEASQLAQKYVDAMYIQLLGLPTKKEPSTIKLEIENSKFSEQVMRIFRQLFDLAEKHKK